MLGRKGRERGREREIEGWEGERNKEGRKEGEKDGKKENVILTAAPRSNKRKESGRKQACLS